MPQELQVLRCYSCEAFQVHIVKKTIKWECKMCGEKQSLQKVYAKGSGKVCRLYVQELNQRRLEIQHPLPTHTTNIYLSEEKSLSTSECENVPKSNRWTEFITPTTFADSDTDSNSIANTNYTFEQPVKKRKVMKSKEKHFKPPGGDEDSICVMNSADESETFMHNLEIKEAENADKNIQQYQFDLEKESQVDNNDGTALKPKMNRFSKWAQFKSQTDILSDEETQDSNLNSNALESFKNGNRSEESTTNNFVMSKCSPKSNISLKKVTGLFNEVGDDLDSILMF